MLNRSDHSGLALLRFALGVVAGILLFYAGHDMRQLSSVTGDTVAEFFDHALGLACYGAGFACLMAAIPVSFVQPSLARQIADRIDELELDPDEVEDDA